MIADHLIDSLADPLSQLEWRVARRADEIAHARKVEAPLNLHCWLVAETEVWGEFNRRYRIATTREPSPTPAAPQ
jgi:hypothetical protein